MSSRLVPARDLPSTFAVQTSFGLMRGRAAHVGGRVVVALPNDSFGPARLVLRPDQRVRIVEGS